MTEQTSQLPSKAAERSQTRVEVKALRKTFGSGNAVVHALDGIDLTVAPGEMVVLLGPSGCGKTTLLRSIAGLERPDDGEISISGRCVYSAAKKIMLPPEARDLGMVFQSYALWPHMDVRTNVAYPLRCRRVPKREIGARVDAVLDAVGLNGLAGRAPAQLSGGQQQRVSLARAIVANPSVILFDEPLSNVDAKVREQLRREIVRLQNEFGFGAIYVTHDQSEAGALADQLVIMSAGHVEESGSPEELYAHPHTTYVATFMGATNELRGVLTEGQGTSEALLATQAGELRGLLVDPSATSTDVRAFFRPEACVLSETRPEVTANVWRGKLLHRMFMGTYAELMVELDLPGEERTSIIVYTTAVTQWQPDAQVWLHVPPSAVRVIHE
jgi:iron(III) transport system ATP-binding protein